MTLLDGCNGNADQGVAREFQQGGLLVQSVCYVIPIGHPRPLPVRSLIIAFLIVGLAGDRKHLALVHADLHELTGVFIGPPGIEAEGRDLRELKRLLVGKRDGAGRLQERQNQKRRLCRSDHYPSTCPCLFLIQ